MRFEKDFSVLNKEAVDCDVQEIVDNPENARIIKTIQEAYNIRNNENSVSYLITYKRHNKKESVIIEDKLMKYFYRNFSISLTPYIKFKGHVVVALSEFEEKIEQEHIDALMEDGLDG